MRGSLLLALLSAVACVNYDIEPKACDQHRPRSMGVGAALGSYGPVGDVEWPMEGDFTNIRCVVHGVDLEAEMFSYVHAWGDTESMPSTMLILDCRDASGELRDVSVNIGVEGLQVRQVPFAAPGQEVLLRMDIEPNALFRPRFLLTDAETGVPLVDHRAM